MSDSAPPDVPDSDAQDRAEIWDEDNVDTDADRFLTADEELDFDERPDVFDATRRVGDEDDEDALIGDDLDDEEIVALGEDKDDEDAEDDAYRLRDQDAFDDDERNPSDLAEEDLDGVDAVTRLGADEVELEDAGDLNNRSGAAGSAKRFESSRLSDEEIERLGYGPGAAAQPGEPRSFDPASERTDEENARHDHLDSLLDQGVEETFPASDPVSVRHIT
jgi:hypothetical protein